jgi:tRNA(adenine34) deaminase
MGTDATPESRATPLGDDEAMLLALSQAAAATEHGDIPVGAIAIWDGRVIAARHNEREKGRDPTAHAEMLALADAAGVVGDWRLTEVTLVVTLEPCPMCAGALVAARVGRLVYGAVDMKAGACGSLYNLCADPRLNHEVAITSGLRAAEAAALLTDFFEARRHS